MTDLIDRAALLADIDETFVCSGRTGSEFAEIRGANKIIGRIKSAPAVDAVEVPEGKRGDYVEWDNGTGYKSFHQIKAVTLEPDGNFRYLFETFHPLVNHNGIIRIISADEMNRMMGAKT